MSQSFILVSLICCLPFAGMLMNLWLKKYVAYISTLVLFIINILVFFFISQHETQIESSLIWFKLQNFSIELNFYINQDSIILLPVVSMISFLVHVFSIGYMAHEKSLLRYFNGLLFFTASMLLFVCSGNLIVIFLAWECLGLASYLLIGFYREKTEAGFASLKAMLLNRFSDLLLISAIILIFANYQSFNLKEIIESQQTLPHLVGWMLLVGVLAKSAQFPLMNWLPSAMTGPSPVSALIHAATMVIAGVYLMIRLSTILPVSVLHGLTTIGSLTALLGAVAATQQFDVKKILAYSTISQLGLMMAAVGIASPQAAILHMVSHAFFKAGLFLGVGALIHYLKDNRVNRETNAQDIRNLGALYKSYPYTFYTILIFSLALCGIPFTSGFLSKEYLLTQAWNSTNSLSIFYFVFIILTSTITVIYTTRLIVYTFFNKSKANFNSAASEKKRVFLYPLIVLSIASFWWIININPFHADFYFFSKTKFITPVWLTIGSTLFFPILFFFAFRYFNSREISSSPNRLLLQGFALDDLQQKLIVQPTLLIGNLLLSIEKKWIDGFIHAMAFATVLFSHIISFLDYWLVDGFVRMTYKASYTLGGWVRVSRSGYVQHYLFWFLFTAVLFIIWVLF